MNLTDEFIDVIYELSQKPFSPELTEVCRNKLLDYFAVTLCGATLIKSRIINYPSVFSENRDGLAPVLGLRKYASLEAAALLNGMSAHAAELDDGERFGMVHPGAPVISALFSAFSKYRFSTIQFLKGLFVGYEATIRMARLLQPELKDNGYHATGPCGCVGAAMAVAVALDFNKGQIKDAFCAAITSASGILKVIRDNSELKPYNAGQAAMCGLTAALTVKMEFRGPGDVLEGEQGFIKMITGTKPSRAIEKASEYLIMRTYVKPYAACRHCHAPIEAGLVLKTKHNIESTSIVGVRVITHRFAAFKHDHTDIENEYSAKMSIPYSVAVALVTGRAGVNEFTTIFIDDSEVQRLTKLVTVEVDDDLTSLVPAKRVAITEITLSNGDTFSHQVDLPLGEPENPIGRKMLETKALELFAFSGIEESLATAFVQQLLEDENFENAISNLVD